MNEEVDYRMEFVKTLNELEKCQIKLFDAEEQIVKLQLRVDVKNNHIDALKAESNLDKGEIEKLFAELSTKNNFIQLLRSEIARDKLTMGKFDYKNRGRITKL